MQAKTIGVMGGMFDPVHNGNLEVALGALESLSLDHVRLVPCHVPNHRVLASVSSENRVQMLQLLAAAHSGLEVDDRECKRDEVSYTVDTLASMREQYVDATLVLILGWDSFCSLPSWHRWRELFGLAHIAVMRRGGDHTIVPPMLIEELRARETTEHAALNASKSGAIVLLTRVCQTVSSTEVRDRIKAGKSVTTLVPEVVVTFIEQNELYGELARDC